MKGTRFVPALAFKALTPLYDRVLPWLFDEQALKKELIAQASIGEGARILDLGCGTGTLLEMARSSPAGAVFGVDADPAMLAAAKRKLGPKAHLIAALAQSLPLRPSSFDLVLSSLFFHHVPARSKGMVLKAAFEVLRPGGTLHILDFGPASTRPRAAIFAVLRLFDGLDPTRDSVDGRLPSRMTEAGFEAVTEVARRDTLIGTVFYWAARRPETP